MASYQCYFREPEAQRESVTAALDFSFGVSLDRSAALVCYRDGSSSKVGPVSSFSVSCSNTTIVPFGCKAGRQAGRHPPHSQGFLCAGQPPFHLAPQNTFGLVQIPVKGTEKDNKIIRKQLPHKKGYMLSLQLKRERGEHASFCQDEH